MKPPIKIIIFSVLLGVGLYLFVKEFILIPRIQAESQKYSQAITNLSNEAKSDPMKFLATLSNVEVVVPGVLGKNDPEGLVRAKLKNNQANFSDGVTSGQIFLNGLLKTQKTSAGVDIFCDLVVSYGGSGNFHFIALFKFADGTLVHTSSLAVGDRIKIVSLVPELTTGNDYQVKANYLDRNNNEAMSTDPTVKQELIFLVKGHKIVQ
ncbi:hypothetical protein COT98_00515 [Candidatus Falkowbacteria bacterium CG10_big_fil_rev_8_21_14_0_10_39_9]|uniref:Uncharacterized protein n=1 Tax=Candidatus Falkowbacteria bacterium CG10_big_fil_rev_8_21_14_0_10_39_9 TaxID=1974566 RepID=A0A2M6WR29_9BACT|nr:MAG: hypothetical protein COT98_00515 [Candidatus Falkowbacteria bacterium CG10_big_fil_rev_8_21_14_0_10_39_9]